MLNVIFICDAHDKDDKEFERFPAHALKNTWGGRIISDLTPVEHEKVVDKTRFNAFYNTPLEAMLSQLRPNKVEVVGVCTSICIMDTVAGLCNRDYSVVVPVKGVADFDNDAHKFALDRMEKIYGAEVI
jgi:nicotinamidase-related amidase